MAGKNNVAGNNGDISVKGRILDRDIGTIIAKLIVECNAGVWRKASRACAWRARGQKLKDERLFRLVSLHLAPIQIIAHKRHLPAYES